MKTLAYKLILWVCIVYDRSTFHHDILRLRTDTSTWELLSDAVPFQARAHHTAVLIKNSIWVIGGSDNDDVFNDVAVFNLDTLQWTTPRISGPTELLGRTAHAADVHPINKNAIVLFGGYGTVDGENVWLSDLVVLDTDKLSVERVQVSSDLLLLELGSATATVTIAGNF